jgi:hypothetical protein
MILLCVVIIGCNIPQSFKPLPPMFKNWEKKNTSDDEIKEALMTCGYVNPFTGFAKNESLNTRAKSSLCMQKKGFHYFLGPIICDQNQENRTLLPACQPVSQN